MTSPEHPGHPWTPLSPQWRTHACTTPGAVLLESSLPSAEEHCSFLFAAPLELLVANRPDEIPALFASIEDALQKGRWVAGWIAYEAEAHFLQHPSPKTSTPLAVFGVYEQPQIFDHAIATNTIAAEAPPSEPLDLALMPIIRTEDYTHSIHQIQSWIAAGETYQVNYTTRLESPCRNAAEQIYEALRKQQPSSYAAVLNLLPGHTILSLSPELFFRAEANGRITTKPMKGTAPRGITPEEDDALANALRHDEKNRAEHVMIVDLLRNDLNRICTIGSVHTDRLFDVERLATVHQMTSTIRGHLPRDTPWYQVFRSMFPGGSITGAPKRHTARLIAQIEPEPRGVYTGAIGYFAPDRSAVFNIAIRTAVLEAERLSLGVGGGIVADSTPESEYREALLKSAFIQRASKPFQLIETMRRTHATIPLLKHHLQRLSESAEALGFACDMEAIHQHLTALPDSAASQRIRLLLHRDGHIDLAATEAPAWPAEAHLLLSETMTLARSPHLRHKSTFRPEYDKAHRAALDAGFTDMLFRNTQYEITETCIANLLVCLNGVWYTPPTQSGVLPGIYRKELIAEGRIEERSLSLEDLRNATHVAVCNALRGITAVTSLQLPGGERIHWQSPAKLPMPGA